MKKLFIAILTVVMVLSGLTVYASNTLEENSVRLDNPERLNKIIITLLMPEVEKDVNNFYKSYLSIEPTVVAYFGDSNITHIVGDIESSMYTVTIEIEPYIGPHISVGRDRMTFDVSADGTVKMKSHDHLESYQLPQHLQSLIKKPLP